MRGIAFIGTAIALLIVLYLTLSNLKAKQRIPALQTGAGDSIPATLTEIPAEVKAKLDQAVEQGEAQRKAVEDLEK